VNVMISCGDRVLCYVFCIAQSHVSDGKAAGRQFVVAFPQHRGTARLYVTSCSWQPVDVIVSLPGHVTGLLWPSSQAPPFTERSYRLVNNGDAVELELPSPVHLDGTNVENKGAVRPRTAYAHFVTVK